MNSLDALRPLLESIDPSLGERMGRVLAHFLWQGAAIAAALALALLCVRRSPVVRYRIACAALALTLAAPAATFWALRPAPPATGASRAADGRSAVFLGPIAPDATSIAPRVSPAASDRRTSFRWIVLTWAAGVGVLSIWRVGGWVRLRRLLRDTRRIDDAWQDRLENLRRRLRVSQAVRLVEAAWAPTPAVVGALRPVVLLPAAALTGLTTGQVEALLAHELAHVRRHDYLVNLFQVVVETVLFYHPAVWWISASIREERENCCDDLAAQACGDRAAYVRALAAMEALRPLPAHLAVAASGGSLIRRVRRLLGAPPTGPSGRRSLAAALVAALFAALPLTTGRPAARAADETSKPASAEKTAAPATAPAAEPAASPITPDDLKATKADYSIGANDQLTIEIGELQGPGVTSVKTARVSETGNVSLPYIGQVHVAGLTEVEAQQTIAKTFKDKRVLPDPQVGVQVAETRSRTFKVLGSVTRPGQYGMLQSDVRVTDALVLAGDVSSPTAIDLSILRPATADAKARRIDIPLERLRAGDLDLNIVIRPGDIVVVKGGDMVKAMRITLAPNGMKIGGADTTWDQLRASLAKLPEIERGRTRLELAAASDDLTLRQYAEARRQAAALVVELKLAGLADVALDAAAAAETDDNVYFISGNHVKHPGAYTTNGRVTLRQALIAAEVIDADSVSEIVVIRHGRDGKEEMKRIEAGPLLKEGKGDEELQARDSVVLRQKKTEGR